MFIEINTDTCVLGWMEDRERGHSGKAVAWFGDMGGKGIAFVAQRSQNAVNLGI